MHEKLLIDKILITLEVGDKTPLFILLGKDGSVHRKGNGSPHTELPMKIGISGQGHFEALMMTINDGMFSQAGVIRQPEMQGTECRLTLIFQGREGVDYSFRAVYGHDSSGPPREWAQILINAVKITEPWYQEQLLDKDGEEVRKWWKFWQD